MQRHSWTNNRQPVISLGPDGPCTSRGFESEMVDVLAAPQQAKTDASLRTLAAISTAHWVSHFHLMVLPMLFPFLKQQLGVGYIELGFALSVWRRFRFRSSSVLSPWFAPAQAGAFACALLLCNGQLTTND